MHGREGEEKNRRRHMLPGPALGKTVADSSGDSFCKDGRKISVGDCALFQAGNSPPFIGIIRWLSSSKEDNNLKLGVNWLYRPADVKLGKGILLEAAPNEVFYSFHKDEIPAASLLHPCKVAFLRKGVELPTGISSFVCRRVYDIANKCLWWLTDQDYIDERQEEVDHLLDKTRLEMHAAVQSGGRSPKPLNGPTSTQQLKPSSDSVLNSSTSFNSQVSKSKKNKRSDQGSEPIKRERLSKPDDGDSGQSVSIKAEIAKVIDKEGGLINFEGVEKLVNLMLLDKAEKKIDFASRKMLADVIAATERFDCLGHFVHLSGVPVLDDWLQEAHKGKIGDGNSPKESDKSIEELLLSLLRALDKLPVNLHALQTCNVGKSVNHLRSHKNLEIQRKARSLVDTWKKRVEAEMKMNDAKSGPSQAASWPGKPSFPEVTHGGNRRPGSSETALKNSSIQPSASKTTSIKLGHVDPVIKSASSSPGSVKLTPLMHSSVTMSSKGATDQLLTTIKEEKSSSSSQSQNNSQSCSSDHAKTVISAWKEDARSSTAGSISASINKNSTGVSRTRRSSNGFMGSGVSGVHKEASIGKSGPTSRNTQSEKMSQSGLTCERTLDMPGAEHGSSHRLIVRLPNPGRSPAHSATGGSLEDLSVMSSRASSPGVSEKLDPFDRKTKVKRDICRATNMAADINTESWQSNDLKNGSGGSDECDRSPATLLDDEQVRNADEFVKPVEISKGASSSGNEKGVIVTEPKPGKPYESSFKSMNALIESCVKQSEATGMSLSAEDDVGMNLLASVAAGEVSKSEMVLPVGSPQKNTSAAEGSLKSNNSNAKLRLSRDDGLAESYSGTDDVDPEERSNNMGPGRVRNESEHTSSHSVEYNNTPGDSKSSFTLSEHNKPSAEVGEQILARRMDLKSDIKLDEVADHICQTASTGLLLEGISADVKEEGLEDGPNLLPDKRKKSTGTENLECVTKFEPKGKPTSSDETKMGALVCKKAAENSTAGVASDFVCGSTGDGCERDCAASSIIVEKEAVEQSSSCPSFVTDSVDRNRVNQGMAQHLVPHPVAADPVEGAAKNEESLAPFVVEKVKEETKPEKVGVMEMTMQLEPTDNGKQEKTTMASKIADGQVGTTNGDETKELSERNEALDHQKSPSGPAQKSEQCLKSAAVSTSSDSEPNEADECASSTETSSTAASDDIAKLDFDLNEGFPSDEGNNQGDPVISAGPKGPSNTAHLPSLLPFSASPLSTAGLPSSITVAAAAKGPFVPPESLLRCKVELGWKGSAATSAFRPAEPRKVPEMPLSAAEILSSDNSDRKPNRPPLDIDLNVTDERVLEDMASRSSNPGASCKSGPTNNHAHGHRSTGMLDLDLNKVDEGTENGHFSVNTTRKMEVPLLPVRPSSSNGFPNSEVNILRDFDLNNGPGLDEASVAEPTMRNQQHHSKSNVPFMPPIPGLRMNNTELGSISSWFPPGNSFPAVAIPSFLPDRVGEQPYPIVANSGVHPRILGSATSGTFGGDLYPAPVLSSSATMTFTPAFPYGGFPLGNSFPLASTSFSGAPTTYRDSSTGGGPCFPPISSQLVGPSGSMSSHYPARPYVISLPEVSTTSGGAESSWKWGRQGLDLNAGLGSNDVEGRNERLSSAPSRQLLVAGSQALAEEQARMYQVKRKEPDGGRDVDRFTYKQPSWQ